MDARLEANRLNWGERTAVHLASRFYDVEGWLRAGTGPEPREVEVLGDVAGLTLLHLQCHFGLDTLAWARAGATVVGLDFAPEAVAAAQELARRAGLAERATFVCADVQDAVRALGEKTFDIVYVSLGALCWLPSVDRWAAQVGALVRPGGRFFIHDGHPFAFGLSDDGSENLLGYFEEPDPYVGDEEYSYTDADRPLANRRTYQWNHGIGEIVTALLRHGLVLESLVEHDWTVWRHFPWLVPTDDGTWTSPPDRPRIPLSFSLLARRPRGDDGRM